MARKRRRKSGIKIKKANRGKLRKSAGAKKGKKIPESKLRQMKKSKNPKTRRRATFALNARRWKKPKRKRRG
jgi:oligoendopeptidase F